MECDHCGRDLASLPYTCNRCDRNFCTEHRLPEAHDCHQLKLEQAGRALKREAGEVGGPWFKDEFRLSNVGESRAEERTTPPSADETPEDGPLVGNTLAPTLGSEAESSKSTGTRGVFLFLLGVPMSLASTITSAVKTVFRYPMTHLWNLGKIVLLLGIIVILAGQVGIGPVDTSPQELASPLADAAANATNPPEVDEQQVERLVREGINERRANRGLASLSSSASLQEQAQLHSEDMRSHNELAHNLPGSTTEERLKIASCSVGGENVAQTWYQERVDSAEGERYIDDEEELAKSLVTQWMNSPPHRENLLRQEWSKTGVGIELTDEDKVYATQVFCA